MRRPSGFILLITLGVLAVATCAGGVFLYFTRMPDPQTADLGGLLRWLVTRDLSQESEATQEHLLARLEQELRNGLELSGAGELNDEQRARLIENADVLGQRWFMKLVDKYSELAGAEQLSFLDRQIDEVRQSGVVKALSTLVEKKIAAEPNNLWASLADRITRWTSRMEPQRKAKVEQFVAAVQGNLLWRSLRAGWLPSTPDSRGG